MLELYLDFMSKQWRGLGVFKMSSVQSVFRTCELMSRLMSNMNNVHNTFFVATLIYNVVSIFFPNLSLPLVFNTSNALEYSNQR